jgi:hypothetical protein
MQRTVYQVNAQKTPETDDTWARNLELRRYPVVLKSAVQLTDVHICVFVSG